MFIVRKSEHINEDIKRNWSSRNYGQEGLNCTKDELNNEIERCLNNDEPLFVSGFELWGQELKNADIRELYENYWVLVDNNRGFGLSCNVLQADNLLNAISEINNENFDLELGEGQTIDCSNAKVVYSKNVRRHVKNSKGKK